MSTFFFFVALAWTLVIAGLCAKATFIPSVEDECRRLAGSAPVSTAATVTLFAFLALAAVAHNLGY